MKLIIAGSRKLVVWSDFILSICEYYQLHPNQVISGGADGIDSCAEVFSTTYEIPFKEIKPDYIKYKDRPKYAPIARNKEMAKEGDTLLLIWDGKSFGSKNMKEEMLKLKKPVYEVILSKS